MRLKVLNIQDVAETQMCCGCGACAYVNPDGIEMVDVLDQGKRPRFIGGGRSDPRSAEAMRACPGIELEHTFDAQDPRYMRELAAGWGPVLELWEGFAADPEIRFAGSSGGAATAIALWAVERGGMKGVLHTAPGDEIPYQNRTIFSSRRDELLAATGSRYAPASPCEGLGRIERAGGQCVFIGKPCDVAGTNLAAALRPSLAKNLGVTIGIFCAGTPSTAGTLKLLRRLGVEDPAEVAAVRYRGNGWPGNATLITHAGRASEVTYQESWGEILTKHVQWRCRICPDHTGEFADIAVGDPWYRPIRPGNPGESLVVVRTERGREIVRRAVADGYLRLEPRAPSILPASQPALLKTRGNVWARILVSRLLGAAAPRYRRMPTFRFWWQALTAREKLRSVLGTVKRVFARGLLRRSQVVGFEHSRTGGLTSTTVRSPQNSDGSGKCGAGSASSRSD